MPGGIVAGLKFGEAVARLWHTWLKSRDRAKLAACKEAAERYIRVNERSGIYEKITAARKKKLLAHYAKRFWKYN